MFNISRSNTERRNLVLCNVQRMIWNGNRWRISPYAYVVGSLMYAQTCTRPDISFAGQYAWCKENTKIFATNKKSHAYL